MIVDKLENIKKYAALNPLFEQAAEFLLSHDLDSLELGKTELKGKDLLVNVTQTKPRQKNRPNWKHTRTSSTSRYLSPAWK